MAKIPRPVNIHTPHVDVSESRQRIHGKHHHMGWIDRKPAIKALLALRKTLNTQS